MLYPMVMINIIFKGFFDNLTEISSIPIDPVLVIIVIAIVMFILSFSGCLGSLRENIFLLKFVSK